MNPVKSTKIFLIDDDALFLKMLEIEFREHNEFEVHTFESGEHCLDSISIQPDVIVLDYHLNGINKTAMNGLQTLDKIKELTGDIPVIMLSSQDKIEVAIQCMHHKALDYVVKSETSFMRLRKIIASLQHLKKMEMELNWYMERM